ncbi:hypothetical protein MKX01_019603 [Papaver californicum]|nr:hypothetical protein MKX01_019603 [Papaver californicum]
MKRKPCSVAPPTEDQNEKPNLFKRKDDETTSKSGFFSSSKRILTVCLVFWMVNLLLVQTYFNPDEHWQARTLKPIQYGPLTWEWSKGTRSYLHPMMFVPLYKFLSFFGLDTPWFMIRAPLLLQSVISSIGDFYLYKLAHRIFGERVAQWTLFSPLVNWFTFFCFTPTLLNNLETRGLVVAALACAVRPTSAITWLSVGLLELFETKDRIKFIFLEIAPIGLMMLGFTCLVDWLMYDSWIFVPLNFLKFNFPSSGVDYYGTHKWHWYFTQVFTVMLFTFIPFTIASIFHMYISFVFSLILTIKFDRQRGSGDAMNFLSHEALEDRVTSVLFLTPFHATPYYSTLHCNFPMCFLDCSPRIGKNLMNQIVGFLYDMVKGWVVPSHIVLFDSQEKQLKEFLISHSFIEVKFFHAHFKVDRELQGSIVVYTLTSQ